VPSGVVPDTTSIRLQTASGTPSFDSEGQVHGRLEVKVGGDWVTVNGALDDYLFRTAEAKVACQQLGNELGRQYHPVSASPVDWHGTDNGIEQDQYKVKCAGTELSLHSCSEFVEVGGWSDSFFGAGNDFGIGIGVSCTFVMPECEDCVAGKFSAIVGPAACMNCTAGSYSTTGAAMCEQVRFGGVKLSPKGC
jgi:hypothetical protein